MQRHPPLVAEFGHRLGSTAAELRLTDDHAWRTGRRSLLVEIWTRQCDDEVLDAPLGVPVRLVAPDAHVDARTIGVGITCDRFLAQDHAYHADILLRLDPYGPRMPDVPDRRILEFRPVDGGFTAHGHFDPKPQRPPPDGARRRASDGRDDPWQPQPWERGLWACLTRWDIDPMRRRARSWSHFRSGDKVTVWDRDRHVATGFVQALPQNFECPLLHDPLPSWLPLSAEDLHLIAKPGADARKPE